MKVEKRFIINNNKQQSFIYTKLFFILLNDLQFGFISDKISGVSKYSRTFDLLILTDAQLNSDKEFEIAISKVIQNCK